MSVEAADTGKFGEFIGAYGADYVTPDGRLVIDQPEIRQALVRAIDGYTTIYRKGCTPPDSVTWGDSGNNERFLAQAVVMTPNLSLSIPNALKAAFWLDPSDPHRMAAAMQAASRPRAYAYRTVSGDLRHERVWNERIWAKAVHRVVTEGISSEQAVDEAIARIKQILSE